MIDQKSSIYIRSKHLWWMLAIMLAAIGLSFLGIYLLINSSQEDKYKDLLVPLASILQTMLTGLTVAAVLYLFQSSKQHAFLHHATSRFLRETLPKQMQSHSRRIIGKPRQRGRVEEFLHQYFPRRESITQSPDVHVNHVTGSLMADYVFEKNFDGTKISLDVFVQVNIKVIFVNISLPRSSYFKAGKPIDSQLTYTFDPQTNDLTESAKKLLEQGTEAQIFFSEAARIGWRTINWAFSEHESAKQITFCCQTKLDESFLHDPAEQLFIANDIASMVRGITDGLNVVAKKDSEAAATH